MPTPEDRRRIIEATGLCLHKDCIAHDKIVESILLLEAKGYEAGQWSVVDNL